ncbi:hypothetical protein D9619_010563 [Psilocybe cf. subviscida]|uniref:Uncharacterized protein n=1 Tax=Psilocybe cf. subviscida TaxID=2480587 RepID=A0A8H5AS33_9AGAR|nr:hypothetical protein D9619_010563 [Psilocybe cf. subviscida]
MGSAGIGIGTCMRCTIRETIYDIRWKGAARREARDTRRDGHGSDEQPATTATAGCTATYEQLDWLGHVRRWPWSTTTRRFGDTNNTSDANDMTGGQNPSEHIENPPASVRLDIADNRHEAVNAMSLLASYPTIFKDYSS